MRKVDLVFFDAGGGHRAASTALKTVATQQGRAWDTQLMNLQEVLDPLDLFRKLTGLRFQEIYNGMLARGWTWGSGYLVPVMHGLIRLYHPSQVQMLTAYWQSRRPDLVVSVIPNFNRSLFQSLRESPSKAPFVTILTDFADYPPHFWMERQDQFVICGTDRAYEQARAMGYPAQRIFRVSGMILRPEFYQSFAHDRGTERMRLGLKPDLPTGLVLFGGRGSPQMLRITESLQNVSDDLQLILVCGKNDKLADALRALRSRIPMHVVGFTDQVPWYMSLADFFIGKPGPGSISEALAMKLPVIIERNAKTLPQERYNAQWVKEQGVGIVLPNFRSVHHAIRNLLQGAELGRCRTNAAAIQNRAVFEITDILQGILDNR